MADADMIEEARRWRQVVGGGMRQAGVFAAAGLVALEHLGRLSEDHANARALARGLAEAGLPVDPAEVETNMVFITLPWPPADAAAFVTALREAGVVINPPKGTRIRLVTHHDVSAADVAAAVRRIAPIAREFIRALSGSRPLPSTIELSRASNGSDVSQLGKLRFSKRRLKRRPPAWLCQNTGFGFCQAEQLA